MADTPKDWGAQEHAARMADIAAVKAGRMSLDEAKARASDRQRQAGLSQFQVSVAVSDHSREQRRAEARAELAKSGA